MSIEDFKRCLACLINPSFKCSKCLQGYCKECHLKKKRKGWIKDLIRNPLTPGCICMRLVWRTK